MRDKDITKRKKIFNFGYFCATISLIVLIASIILITLPFVDETARIFLIMLGLVFSCPISVFTAFWGTLLRKRNIKIEKLEHFEIDYRAEFSGEKEEEFICMICKLEICSGDLVYICPQCNSHYHEDHFLDWLQIETICPVCEYNFPYLE